MNFELLDCNPCGPERVGIVLAARSVLVLSFPVEALDKTRPDREREDRAKKGIDC